MLPDALIPVARELAAICIAVAALDAILLDGRLEGSFRVLCAMSVGLCALRAAMRLLA